MDAGMVRALGMARAARGTTSPNPPVGAAVVREGRIVGEGATQPPPGDHAEIVALRQAGDLARGAALYVTLEPCSHFGRTPPCADAVIAAGIARVIASVQDPNPKVSGRGFDRLRQAGIAVEIGEGRADAEELIAPHAKFATTGLPLITVKFAMSLDGKIATRTGDSKWITGESARRHVHELRAQSDAIMAGIGTALADDPQLTARDADGAPLPRQPLRVIADSAGRTPPGAALLRQPGNALIATASESAAAKARALGADAIALPAADGRVDLRALMTYLAERRIISVFAEGGGTLLGALLDAGLADKIAGFIAPTIIGGQSAPSPIAGIGAEMMRDAIRLSNVKTRRFGDDMAILGDIRRAGETDAAIGEKVFLIRADVGADHP